MDKVLPLQVLRFVQHAFYALDLLSNAKGFFFEDDLSRYMFPTSTASVVPDSGYGDSS